MLCEGLRRGQLSLRGSSTRATGAAKVFDEGDKSRGKMLCDFSYSFEKLAGGIGFT